MPCELSTTRFDGVTVTVVGAGLAGLACARHLQSAGVEVTVVEAGDAVGGRVRTDVVDGMLLDRGFQVHNTGYPEARQVLDHDALDLKAFTAGALIRVGDGLRKVGNPLRQPTWALPTVDAPIGSLPDKARIALLAARDGLLPASRLLAAPETTTLQALRDRGFSETVIDRFFRPFLAGVFLEDQLATSSRFFDLVWRSFVRGTQCVPAAGMGAMPAQLARGLTVELGHEVTTLDRNGPVVVATDPGTAARLLDLPAPPMNSVTTHYHLADAPPVPDPVIVLDGERSGPVSNTVVLTNAAPSYAPGRVLISSSSVSGDASEPAVRAHLQRLYGVSTSAWEHVRAYEITDALPSQSPPVGRLRSPVRLEKGLYVCGDHRDSASIQGALVSGRRAAQAALTDLRGAA